MTRGRGHDAGGESGASETVRALPPGLLQSFRLAAAELGMCSAAWLFVDEIFAAGGQALVGALRDHLGRAYPVLDAVAAARLEGVTGPAMGLERMLGACEGLEGIVVVGLETRFLDALVSALPTVAFRLVRYSVFSPDWQRVIANYGRRVELVAFDEFQRHAGPRSGLLTFVYGGGGATHALPAWARTTGEDVRTQFGALIGWDVLPRPFYVYPRWLVGVSIGDFTELVTG